MGDSEAVLSRGGLVLLYRLAVQAEQGVFHLSQGFSNAEACLLVHNRRCGTCEGVTVAPDPSEIGGLPKLLEMDQATLKKQVLDFSRDDEHDNRRCIDCSSPHPQWASANNAVFMCIQCAGVHRGFGVHISFVRSVTMDTWKPEEVAKMKLGGNKAFRDFLRSYIPPSNSFEWSYDETMHSNAKELYNSWPALQYREKLSLELDGKTWSPSPPTPQFLANQTPSRPASAQSLRTRSQNRGAAPSPLRGLPVQNTDGASSTSTPDTKAAKENFFAGLGAANAERPDHLPPSQGGKYAGFGSTPDPPPEALALSSKALPTLQELQTDPSAAFSKGWSFLSTAVSSASKAVNENLVQPGVQAMRENAPVVQKNIDQFASTANVTMAQLSGNLKEKTGVDVAENWGILVDRVKALGVAGPTPEQKGYRVADDGWGEFEEESSALYRDEPDSADFFKQFESPNQSSGGAGAGKDSTPTTAKQPEVKDVEKEGWDDWKAF